MSCRLPEMQIWCRLCCGGGWTARPGWNYLLENATLTTRWRSLLWYSTHLEETPRWTGQFRWVPQVHYFSESLPNCSSVESSACPLLPPFCSPPTPSPHVSPSLPTSFLPSFLLYFLPLIPSILPLFLFLPSFLTTTLPSSFSWFMRNRFQRKPRNHTTNLYSWKIFVPFLNYCNGHWYSAQTVSSKNRPTCQSKYIITFECWRPLLESAATPCR